MVVGIKSLREGMFVQAWQATVASVDVIDGETVVKTLSGGVHKVNAEQWFSVV